jgi:hypothetical protein
MTTWVDHFELCQQLLRGTSVLPKLLSDRDSHSKATGIKSVDAECCLYVAVARLSPRAGNIT